MRKYDEQAVAQSGAMSKLAFIVENLRHLQRVDKGGKMERAACDMFKLVTAGKKLTVSQLSYVDGIYEKVMAGAGFDSVPLHIDKKRRGLRFGRV